MMDWSEITPQIILTVLTGLFAATPIVYGIWRSRHKDRADVAKAITEAAGELVEDYQKRIDRIEAILDKQEEKIACQERKIEKQSEQIARQKLQLETQEEELRLARDRITALEVERDEFLEGIMSLCSQLREAGLEPRWQPEVPEE